MLCYVLFLCSNYFLYFCVVVDPSGKFIIIPWTFIHYGIRPLAVESSEVVRGLSDYPSVL